MNFNLGQHPCLSLTPQGVKNIRKGLGDVPLFDAQLAKVKSEIDGLLNQKIDIPVPKDMAGGYTHETHKRNYKWMQKAGNLYQITGEDKYAEFVKTMLFDYAEMFPTLPLHPTMKSYATGKLFWQCLNDANWMVFTSQAYDCIYNYLSDSERQTLEKNLFIPYANFLSEENPRFFNRIHNHSTWANAAVGMMALAMDNDELLEKALYGLKDDGINPSEIDNDGGFIKKEGNKKAGFLAQLDYSFSPEGYFTEGPYYQRYAIFPFLAFSHALHNKRPDLNIFKYRNGILSIATNTLLQLTDPSGNFFPINDSQKGMNITSYELVTAVDLMYLMDSSQEDLLDWAATQGTVAFNEAGFHTAQKLAQTKTKQPVKTSLMLGDGNNGDEGGIAVLRMEGMDLLFKFAAQGMGHGHFDRLSYSLYNNHGEIVQDYGAVRWVNVDQKGGGRYLPENKTFGKQSIGHNTIVVNETSHYKGKVKAAETAHPELYHADLNNANVKMISAKESNAYDETNFQRTFLLIEDEVFTEPVVVDIMNINSEKKSMFDLPIWFVGHQMKSSFDCPKEMAQMIPLGKDNGYQHIWKESSCTLSEEHFQFNWFGNNRFYTMTAHSEVGDKIIMGRAGANDPNYNLRPDPVMIHRREDAGNTIFMNVIESHGAYSTVTEIPSNPYTQIETIDILYSDEDYVVCAFSNAEMVWKIMLSLNNTDAEKTHKVKTGNQKYKWQGPYKLTKSKK